MAIDINLNNVESIDNKSNNFYEPDDTKYPNSKATFDLFSSIADFSYNLLNQNTFVGGTFVINSSTGLVTFSSSNNWISVELEVSENTDYFLQGNSAINPIAPVFIFADENNIHISSVLYSDFTGIMSTPNGCSKVFIRLVNAGGAGISPTDSPYLTSVQLSIGNSSKPFVDYGNKIKESALPDSEYNYPKFFVKIMPSNAPYTGVKVTKDVAYVYENLNGNRYVKHTLVNQRWDYSDWTSGDFHGGNIVRYAGSIISIYNQSSNTFADEVSTVIITTPESEFVANFNGWSGGYHGNEDFNNIYFMVDGTPYNINGDLDFTESSLIDCESFGYIMSSVIKLDSDKSDLFKRLKDVQFINGGYTVRTKLEDLVDSQVGYMYTGICCVGKIFDSVVSDSAESFNPTGSTDVLISNDSFSRKMYYGHSDYNLTVSSKLIDDENKDKESTILLWDRVNDTKYYRRTDISNTTIGSTLEFKQIVKMTTIF